MNTTMNVTSVSRYLPADIPNIILLALIAVLGTANLSLIMCFVQDKSLRKPFNYIVLGMAVGNFLMSDVTAVMDIVSIVRKFIPPGVAWCYVVTFVSVFSYTQSMLFITLMAVIRTWSGLAKHHTTFSTTKSIVCIAIVYVVSIAWGSIVNLPGNGDIERCMDTRGADPSPGILFPLYMGMVIVLFVITICSYVTLILRMYCKNTMAKNRKSEILTLKAAIAVSGLFMACYLIPICVTLVNFGLPADKVINVLHISTCVAYLQSAVNPYIYLATNSHFRQIYKKSCYRALACCTQRPRAVADNSITHSATNSNNISTSHT